jgi:alkaline phosphatase D
MNPNRSPLARCLSLFYVLALAANGAAAPYLKLAPMIGHTTSTNARIWANASGPARLSIRFSTAPDLSDAKVIKGPKLEETTAFMDTVLVPNLKPAQRYYYCPLLDSKPAVPPPYPSFTTAPPEGQPGRVRIAFTSCVGYHGYDSAAGFADLARTNFDLLLMLGDNHYANTNDAAIQRAFYFDQRNTAGYRDVSSRLPIYAIWDDHDYGPDNSDGTLPNKARGLETFREHWANPAFGEPDNPGVYFRFTRAGVDLFLLDGRYHRDPNNTTNLIHKTMLGEKQLAWLKRELLASRAPIKLLISGGEWQSNGTDDSWTSFQAERDDIFRFIEENHIVGVLLLSGDRHFTGAYQVKGKWIEVTVGPIGSSNATTKNLPEMFLNFSDMKAKFYCIYDLDTTPSPPRVVLEVYRVGEGLAQRRTFRWDEVLGVTKIPPLPPSPKTEIMPAAKSGQAKPKSNSPE